MNDEGTKALQDLHAAMLEVESAMSRFLGTEYESAAAVLVERNKSIRADIMNLLEAGSNEQS